MRGCSEITNSNEKGRQKNRVETHNSNSDIRVTAQECLSAHRQKLRVSCEHSGKKCMSKRDVIMSALVQKGERDVMSRWQRISLVERDDESGHYITGIDR
jgi:hypothetical protein